MALYRITVEDKRTYVFDTSTLNGEDPTAIAFERFNAAKHKITCSLPLTPCEAYGNCPYNSDNSLIKNCGDCYTHFVKKEIKQQEY